MRHLCIAAVLVLFTSASASAQAGEPEIQKILNEMVAATYAGDKATYGKYLADSLQWVNHQGAIDTKAKRLEGVKRGKVALRDVDIK
ncbi:MAG: hypothetical protein AB7N65_25650 [Vicinamibacterales bacterium]